MSDIFNDLYNQYNNFKNGLKGSGGEFFTELQLKNLFNNNTKIFRNAYVTANGKDYSQIDLIILHEKGIFVLECKNYGGWIFGSNESKNWTQMFSKTKKYSFFNPVMQNRTHIKTLAQHLQMSDKCFVSYIVFGERCEFKKIPEPTLNIKVLRQDTLAQTLKNDIEARPIYFTSETMAQLEYKLNKLCNVSKEVKEKHIADIKKLHPDEHKKEPVGTSFLSSFLKF